MVLELRTMGIFAAITPFLLGLIMLMYLNQRKVYGGFQNWVLASFAFAIGNLLIDMRGTIPDFASIIIGNCINVYGEILIYEGIRLFYGRPPFKEWNYILLGFYIIFQLYFTYIEPNINARMILVSGVMSVLILRSASQLFRCTIPELKTTSRSAGYLFIATAMLPFVRGIYVAIQTKPMDLFRDALSSWFSLGIIISLIAWTFYFFFLNSARLELDLELARRELEIIAITDSLTNSYNRRHFEKQAENEFQRSKRFGGNLSFLMLDTDHFKIINDTHGHQAGDEVLIALAAILESEVRALDLVARYGGDEFIIMLLDTNHEQAYSVAERIRRVVARSPVTGVFGELKISLSVGVSTVEVDDIDLATTLRRADAALYHAKKSGRNRVVFA